MQRHFARRAGKHFLWKMFRFPLKCKGFVNIIGSVEPLLGVAPQAATRRCGKRGRVSFSAPRKPQRTERNSAQ